jgi:hypothetical protein
MLSDEFVTCKFWMTPRFTIDGVPC